MTQEQLQNNNVFDDPRTSGDEEHEQGEILEEFDVDSWVATGEMQRLPTNIFKKNTLSPSCQKSQHSGNNFTGGQQQQQQQSRQSQ